jgi:hypothetical protein
MRIIPLSVIRKAGHWDKFKDASEVTQAFVAQFFKPATKLLRIKSVSLLVRLACRRILRIGRMPLCHRTISQQLCQVEALVQESFPGYLRAGLLPMLLNTNQNPNASKK